MLFPKEKYEYQHLHIAWPNVYLKFCLCECFPLVTSLPPNWRCYRYFFMCIYVCGGWCYCWFFFLLFYFFFFFFSLVLLFVRMLSFRFSVVIFLQWYAKESRKNSSMQRLWHDVVSVWCDWLYTSALYFC